MARGEPSPDGYDPPRDLGKAKPAKDGNRPDGWQILGKITKRVLGIKKKDR